MKKIFLLLIGCLLFTSCELVFFYLDPQSNNPVKDEFSYYDEGFKLDDKSALRTDGIYLKVDYAAVDRYPEKDSIYQVRRFFENGQMFKVGYIREIQNLDNIENVQRGYYKVEDNNITFETFTAGRKEFWYWSGTIKGGTLHITSVKGEGNKKRGYKAPKEVNEIYIFKSMPELKNSVQPNW